MATPQLSTSYAAQSQRWPSDKAVLLISGVGNATPGSYADVVEQLQVALGDRVNEYAFYFLYHEQIADWAAALTETALPHAKIVNGIANKLPHSALSNVVADFVADILRPVLIADARLPVRTAVLDQLWQIQQDGAASGIQAAQQQVSVIAHGLGCFHAYEALTHASRVSGSGSYTGSFVIQLKELIFIASPVQLIRTVGAALGSSLANSNSVYCVSQPDLRIPSQTNPAGVSVSCASHVVSIAGNLDPVGGYFFREPMKEAYANLPGQAWFVDEQRVIGEHASEDLALAEVFQNALRVRSFPYVSPENPHNWAAYCARHASDIRSWLA